MEKVHLHGVSEQDSDAPPEDILVQHDRYIVALVTQLTRDSSNVGHPDVLDLEIDEIVQQVRIKFYHALLSRHIDHPKAYIRIIALNELRDLSRKRKPLLPLQFDDDGELYMGDMIVMESEDMAAPEDVYIDDEGVSELMEFAAPAISNLPARQRLAMICKIKDEIGERLEVIEAFALCFIEIEDYQWPEGEAEKNLLKASLPAARQNLMKTVGDRLEAHKRRRLMVNTR